MKFSNSDFHFSHDSEPTAALNAETLLAEYADGRRNFNNVDLRDSNLAQAKLSMISLEEAILQKVNLSNANLAGATLNHVDLSFATLTNTNFIAADLVRAKLIGANLAGAVMSGANLSGASFRKADLSNCIFAGANLSGVDFSGAVLNHTNFGGANLKAANLSDVDLTDIDLTDIDLTETILPESLAGERWGSQNRDLSLNFDEAVPGWGRPIEEPKPEQTPVQDGTVQSEMMQSRMIPAETGRYLVNPTQDEDPITEYQSDEYSVQEFQAEVNVASDDAANGAYGVSEYIAEEYVEDYVSEEYISEEYISEEYVSEKYLDTSHQADEETAAVLPLSSLGEADTAALDTAGNPWPESITAMDDDALYLNALDALDAIGLDAVGQEPTTQGDHPDNPFVFVPPSEAADDQPPADPPEAFTLGAVGDDLSMTVTQDFTVDSSASWPSDDPNFPLEETNIVLPEDTNAALTEDTNFALPEDTTIDPSETNPSDSDLSNSDPSEVTQFVQPETPTMTFDPIAAQAASVVNPGDSPAMPSSTSLSSAPAPRKAPESSAVPGAKANHPLNSRVVHSIQAALGRRVQYSLQRKLLDIYHEKCAVTGCDVQPLLDTVFITSHDRDKADHPSQCLVLRTDLKTLYDLKLLAIHPQRLTVLLSPQLLESDYGRFQGHQITIPDQKIYYPSPESLTQNLEDCIWYDDSYQESSQPVVLASPDPRPDHSHRWLSLPSLVALGIGMIAGAGLIWPLRNALMAEPSAVEPESPPAQISPQPQNRINIQAGDLRYNQQGVILDQKSYISLEQAQQLELLSGEVPEDYQQQHQGETYVSLSYLADLGTPVRWDAETRTAILDCCQSTELDTISLAINNRDWPSAGIIVDNRAYVPQSKLAELNLDFEALNPAHSIEYQNETYVRASDLNDLSAVVEWDADSRVLNIRR